MGECTHTLEVNGCTHELLESFINGNYESAGVNHGKPVYQCYDNPRGYASVIYYWDDRDGPMWNGWWIGDVVAGYEAWAFNSDNASKLPPSVGWLVPAQGPIDETMVVEVKDFYYRAKYYRANGSGRTRTKKKQALPDDHPLVKKRRSDARAQR